MRGKFFVERMRIRVARVFMAGVALLIIFSGNGWEQRSPLIETGLLVLGIFLVAIAALGRMWCSLYIAGRKTQSLVTVGPYSLCRNPLYVFSLLGCLGIGFATETFLIPGMMLAAFVFYYKFVIKKEETRLEEIHGQAYREYKKRTRSVFPRFADFKEPQEYLVNPVLFRSHILSAVWFVWFLGVFEMIEYLHETGILPSKFLIY